MTIDEAIRLKQLTGDEFIDADPDDLDQAERLSIEALNAWRRFKQGHQYTRTSLLPGETEE